MDNIHPGVFAFLATTYVLHVSHDLHIGTYKLHLRTGYTKLLVRYKLQVRAIQVRALQVRLRFFHIASTLETLAFAKKIEYPHIEPVTRWCVLQINNSGRGTCM